MRGERGLRQDLKTEAERTDRDQAIVVRRQVVASDERCV
jgi:hypothetical protein